MAGAAQVHPPAAAGREGLRARHGRGPAQLPSRRRRGRMPARRADTRKHRTHWGRPARRQRERRREREGGRKSESKRERDGWIDTERERKERGREGGREGEKEGEGGREEERESGRQGEGEGGRGREGGGKRRPPERERERERERDNRRGKGLRGDFSGCPRASGLATRKQPRPPAYALRVRAWDVTLRRLRIAHRRGHRTTGARCGDLPWHGARRCAPLT